MSRRRSLPDWRVLLAVACALAVLLVGLDLDLGFGLSLFLAVLGGAFVYASARVRGAARPAPIRSGRPAARPRLRAGHEVVLLRDVAGGLSEFVPQGSRGVVTGTGWGKVAVAFTVHAPLGARQVTVSLDPDDVRQV